MLKSFALLLRGLLLLYPRPWTLGYGRGVTAVADGGAGLLGHYFSFLSAVFQESATVDDVVLYGPVLRAWQRRLGGWDVTQRGSLPLDMPSGNLPRAAGHTITSTGIHVTRPVRGTDFRAVGPFLFLAGMLR